MEPILIDLPSELTTDRLLLRVPRPGDGARVNAAVVDSATELAMWMPEWGDPTPKVPDSEKWVRSAAAKFLAREQVHFSLYLKGADTCLGFCGLHHIDWHVPTVEIGYWLRTPYCRQGYMAEAVAAVTCFAFNSIKAHRVQLKCDSKNERSAAVARRAGFSLDGVMRNHAKTAKGELRHICIFSKITG